MQECAGADLQMEHGAALYSAGVRFTAQRCAHSAGVRSKVQECAVTKGIKGGRARLRQFQSRDPSGKLHHVTAVIKYCLSYGWLVSW